jgi:hypothetical protein
MGWDESDVARERPVLQALADYKYDSYERYQPGMRFIESLACWLAQFDVGQERECAYQRIREKLIFISRDELDHLVASSYPDYVRPRLLQRAAADEGIPAHLVGQLKKSRAFRRHQRSCLFVGLSDGARTDHLRRTNPVISNEQVLADYHGLRGRAAELLKDLRKDLPALDLGDKGGEDRFTSLVLLDDFSASGLSYLRVEEDEHKGKIARIAAVVGELDLFSEDLEVMILLYVATNQSYGYLEKLLHELAAEVPGAWTIGRMQGLGKSEVTRAGDDAELDRLIQRVYDPAINDRHMKKGGSDGRYGFANCGLTTVLSHNTPNNSLALLWADTDNVVGLFPRVTRHRENP